MGNGNCIICREEPREIEQEVAVVVVVPILGPHMCIYLLNFVIYIVFTIAMIKTLNDQLHSIRDEL
jgi:hypothetical protein